MSRAKRGRGEFMKICIFRGNAEFFCMLHAINPVACVYLSTIAFTLNVACTSVNLLRGIESCMGLNGPKEGEITQLQICVVVVLSFVLFVPSGVQFQAKASLPCGVFKWAPTLLNFLVLMRS
jgi:hypothetical protein